MARRRIAKDAAAALPFAEERLLDMPLSPGRVAKGHLVFAPEATYLHLGNLEDGLTWSLALARTAKAVPGAMAASFHPLGSAHVRAFHDVPASPIAVMKLPEGPVPAIDGSTEFGIQTPDDHEYFLSKFGDMVGIVRVKRKKDGNWSAGLAKSNVPRVLSKEAVAEGLMPPQGHSALPKSLESVVPAEYQYWKASGDVAKQMRDALASAAFFTDDTVKAVDGELRKVEVKYFLYDHANGSENATEKATFAERVASVIPTRFEGYGHSPMADSEDWIETLDKHDESGVLAILSPPDRATSAREMMRAATTLKKADWLLEHNDTRANRAAFAGAGVLFKLAAEPDRIFCASFAPTGVFKALDDGPVVKRVTFQGIQIDIDRPTGFVQTGKDADGNDWSRTYAFDYGFFPGSKGGDGEDLDVFIGPNETAASAYWVTQKKDDGSFDEYKVFVGFDSERAALDAYAAHIPTKFFDGIVEVPIGMVKSLLGLEPNELQKRIIAKLGGLSYNQLRDVLTDAVRAAYPDEGDSSSPCCPTGCWVEDVYDDRVIYRHEGECYSDGYTINGGDVALAGQPTPVIPGWIPKANLAQIAASKEDTTSGNLAVGGALVPAQAGKRKPKTYKVAVGSIFTPASAAIFKTALGEYVRKRTDDTTKPTAVSKIEAMVVTKAHVTKDGEEHYVLGIVLEPDVVDAQQDTYNAEEIRTAQHRFMSDFRNLGLMHKSNVNDKVQILESYIAPVDFDLGETHVKKGTWMMAVRVADDGLWQAVKSGELTGFSIGGTAIRKPDAQGV